MLKFQVATGLGGALKTATLSQCYSFGNWLKLDLMEIIDCIIIAYLKMLLILLIAAG